MRLIFILIVFVSCQGSFSNGPNHFENKYSLEVVGEVNFPLDSLTGYNSSNLQTISKNDTKLLYIKSNRTINIYDIEQEAMIEKIVMEREGPNSIGVSFSGFYVHSYDSIFIYSNMDKKLSLINSKGHVLDTYTTHTGEKYEPYLDLYTVKPMFMKNNKLYGCTYLIDPSVEDHTKIKVTWVLDLETKKVKHLYNRPEIYNQGSWGMGGFMLRVYHDYNAEKDLYIHSFAIDPNIHVYDGSGNMQVYYAGSKDIKKIEPVRSDRTEWIYDDEGFQHEALSGYYTAIIYDPYQKVYYRYANLPISRDEYSSPFQLGKKIAIIILDDKFQKVGEYKLSEDYTNYMFFITEAGIHFSNKKKYDQHEDTLTFEIFNLKKL